MVGQLEAPFEIAIGDSHVQEFAAILAFVLRAAHDQLVLLRGNIDLGRCEASHRDGDQIAIVGDTLDIERGVIIALHGAACIFQQIEQPVETDGGAAIGGEIGTVHFIILHWSNIEDGAGKPALRLLRAPQGRPAWKRWSLR